MEVKGRKRPASQDGSDTRQPKRARDEFEKPSNPQPQKQHQRQMSVNPQPQKQHQSQMSEMKNFLLGVVSPGDPSPNYSLQKVIGSGGFGSVYQGISKIDNQKLAFKVQPLNEKTLRPQLVIEVMLLKYTQHENLVRYIDSYILDNNLWIMMGYVDGVNLNDMIMYHKQQGTTMRYNIMGAIVRRIVQGLEYLHSIQIMHRDIKPANVLIGKNGQVKVTDLGLSAQEGSCYNICGTLAYMAPEILKRCKYNRSVDVWALGMTVTAIVNSQHPFAEIPTKEATIHHIVNNMLPPLKNATKLPNELNQFVSSCLAMEPKKRLSAPELRHHDFFRYYATLQRKIGEAVTTIRSHMDDNPEP
jgi:serine/threonine protein kinase